MIKVTVYTGPYGSDDQPIHYRTLAEAIAAAKHEWDSNVADAREYNEERSSEDPGFHPIDHAKLESVKVERVVCVGDNLRDLIVRISNDEGYVRERTVVWRDGRRIRTATQ